jgi:Tetratricopeptide repeat
MRGLVLKSVFGVSLLVSCFFAAGPQFRAQAQSPSGSGQSQPAAGGQNPAPAQQPPRPTTQTNANPFPEDTSSVPVIPTRTSPDVAPGDEEPSAHVPMPAEDGDPVRSPEEAADAADSSSSSSSSSLAGMGDLNPPDDDTTQPGKHKKKGEEDVVPEHHETAAEDEEVGSYYLSNKDWKGALSRFQSALVLDPDNPDVYWGLAECERYMGDFADARANYLKVREYDPGSRHAKEAAKALDDPEIANAKAEAAKPGASGQPAAQPQQ